MESNQKNTKPKIDNLRNPKTSFTNFAEGELDEFVNSYIDLPIDILDKNLNAYKGYKSILPFLRNPLPTYSFIGLEETIHRKSGLSYGFYINQIKQDPKREKVFYENSNGDYVFLADVFPLFLKSVFLLTECFIRNFKISTKVKHWIDTRKVFKTMVFNLTKVFLNKEDNADDFAKQNFIDFSFVEDQLKTLTIKNSIYNFCLYNGLSRKTSYIITRNNYFGKALPSNLRFLNKFLEPKDEVDNFFIKKDFEFINKNDHHKKIFDTGLVLKEAFTEQFLQHNPNSQFSSLEEISSWFQRYISGNNALGVSLNQEGVFINKKGVLTEFQRNGFRNELRVRLVQTFKRTARKYGIDWRDLNRLLLKDFTEPEIKNIKDIYSRISETD